MESLVNLVTLGVLTLRCPECRYTSFEEGIIPNRLLHCNRCYIEKPEIDWVQKIIRQGDDDPYIHLCISCTEFGFSVQINTEQKNSEDSESARFCAGGGGGRSIYTTRKLTEIATALKSGTRPAVRFHGLKGQLKIYQGRGDPDMWMKTEDIEGDIYHGAVVEFKTDSIAAPHILTLMKAMLMDCKEHPLPFQVKISKN